MRLQFKLIIAFLCMSTIPLIIMGIIVLRAISYDEVLRIHIQDTLLLSSFITVTAVVALSVLIARSITQPLRKLHHISSEISKGNFAVEIPEINETDEVGELTASFRRMMVSLTIMMKENKKSSLYSNHPTTTQQPKIFR